MMGFRTVCRFVSRAYRRAGSDVYSSPLESLKPSLPIFLHPVEPASSFSTYSISHTKKSAIWRRFARFLMFGSLSTLAGIGYVSYAYTLEELVTKTQPFVSWSGELAKKTKNLRKSAKQDGDPIIDHILGYNRPFISLTSFTMSVATEAIVNYLSLRLLIEEIVKEVTPPSDKLLPDMDPVLHNARVFTLVLDLNETLVHSDWKDELHGDGESCKRPGFDAFLERLYEMGCYELVLYTDEIGLAVIVFQQNQENGGKLFYTLTSGSTKYQDGKNYRDLSKLNRDPSRIIYVSAHALENCLQPENCVPIKPWKKQQVDDTTLTDLLSFLEYVAYKRPDDIRPILLAFQGKDIANEFIDPCSKYDQRRRKLGSEGRWLTSWPG